MEPFDDAGFHPDVFIGAIGLVAAPKTIKMIRTEMMQKIIQQSQLEELCEIQDDLLFDADSASSGVGCMQTQPFCRELYADSASLLRAVFRDSCLLPIPAIPSTQVTHNARPSSVGLASCTLGCMLSLTCLF